MRCQILNYYSPYIIWHESGTGRKLDKFKVILIIIIFKTEIKVKEGLHIVSYKCISLRCIRLLQLHFQNISCWKYIDIYTISRLSSFYPSLSTMARVFPQAGVSSPYMSTERETFTVWMKSLVYQTNGLTVYNSNGEITYRVENYDKSSNEVHIMDLHGNILFTIRKKVTNELFLMKMFKRKC